MDKKLPVKQLSVALSMAAAYYSYPYLLTVSIGVYIILALFALFAAIIAFFRTLRHLPHGTDTGLRQMGIFVMALAIGFSLGIAARRSVSGPAEFGLPAENIRSVRGMLREDPRTLYGGSGLGSLELQGSGGDDGLRTSARGKITVFFPAESIPRLREFGRGSEIFTEGRVSEGRMGLLFNAASVYIVNPAPPLESFRTGLRLNLLDRFQSRQERYGGQGNGAPVWGGLASALLLGVRDDLNVDLAEGFRNAGSSYVLALSGMHLAIISGVLAFLIRRPLGIRWASLVGALFIVFYVFLAGSQPSLVRSALMYLIGTVTVWGLLKRNVLSILSMAFTIQLVFQSDTGIYLGFILSYLALFGILTLGESFRDLFRGRLPEIINASLSASLGAFIFTAPIVAIYFDSLRPIGILAGPLLAFMAAPFMILSLAALLASFLPLPLWGLLDFILIRLYNLIDFTVSLAGQVPGILISNPVHVLIFTVLFTIFTLFIHKKDQVYRSKIAAFP